MGYKKLVVFGNNAELYEYERDLGIHRGGNRKRKSNDDLPSVVTDGEALLQEERRLGKRKDSAQRASVAFKRLVLSNLDGGERPLLVTLTHAENITSLRQGYENYTSFIQSLRRKYGKTFKYICVPEFQRRGSVHFHALFWGLPTHLFLSERQTRELANLWGHGYIFLKETDGADAIANYLSKYMAKAFLDPRLKNKKAFCASRNVLRPIEIKGASPIWPVLDDYGVIEDSPVLDETYDTSWLKKCHHRIFKIKNDNS